MLLVLTIGLKDISSLKFIGLIVLPPVLYIMLSKTIGVSVVLTRNCIALSIAGWLYWLTLDAEQWLKFVWFGIAIFLIGYVLVITIIRTKKWAVSLILLLGLPIVVSWHTRVKSLCCHRGRLHQNVCYQSICEKWCICC